MFYHENRSGHRKSMPIGRDLGVKQIEVYFYQGRMHGWININLSVDGIPVKIWASAVISPFDDLIEFLKDVLAGAFPSEFDLDEEGPLKRFIALPHPDKGLFRFRLTNGRDEVFMDNIFDRAQFVLAFYDDLMLFMRTHFDGKYWGEYWLYHGSIEPLEKLVEEARHG